MAVATLTPARALRRPRRADPRALIGVCVTLIALAGSVAFWVTSSDARPVLVATRDLPVGTTVRASDLTIAYVRMDDSLYRAALPADMLESLVGRQLGEPVHALQVLARAQVANQVGLSTDQVAITVPARPESAVDGRLHPGDSVQVLVILDRARVFEVGRDQSLGSSSPTAETDSGAHGSIASVTLAITAEQARQLAEARRTGELDVLLLPPPEVAHP